MSQEINEFINGTEPQLPLDARVRNAFRNEGIVDNFRIFALSNGALVVRFEGPLPPRVPAILTGLGFTTRTGNLGGDVVVPDL